MEREKGRIKTDVAIDPSPENGLFKKSVADGQQTRPVDRRHRLVKIRGKRSSFMMQAIDRALIIVFGLDSDGFE